LTAAQAANKHGVLGLGRPDRGRHDDAIAAAHRSDRGKRGQGVPTPGLVPPAGDGNNHRTSVVFPDTFCTDGIAAP